MQSSRARHKQERQDRQDCQLAESAERHVCRELRAAMGKRSLSCCAWCSPVESGVPARARTRDCAEGNVIKAQGQGKEDSAGSKGKEATAGLQGKEGSADPQGKEGSASAQARGKDQNEAGQEGSGGPQGKQACAGFQPSEQDWDYELSLRHQLTRIRNNQEAIAAVLESPSPLVNRALVESCSFKFLP